MTYVTDLTAETRALIRAAENLCVAARTAPKGKGKDLLEAAIATAEDKERLQSQMRQIGQRDHVPFFLRDADNLDHAPVVVLLGTRKAPLLLPPCGFCGFVDCEAMLAAGGTCSFNTGDLGIAIG
ncbi:MAG: ferredoxin, partial [Desulfuromonadales bacterium]